MAPASKSKKSGTASSQRQSHQYHHHTPLSAPSSTFYHALLRPAILQILRAQGYYTTTPTVLDSLTELAGNYLSLLAHQTAIHAAHNNEMSTEPTIVDVRMALQECGMLGPEKVFVQQEISGVEDTRGTDSFLEWCYGPKNRKIRKVARAGEEDEGGDYLSALKKKHSKTDQDAKYAGTILGKGLDHGDIPVEGGEIESIAQWNERLRKAAIKSPEERRKEEEERRRLQRQTNGHGGAEGEGDAAGSSPNADSPLSELTDRDVEDIMDLT